METNFKPLPKIEIFNIDMAKKVINESRRFYIIDSREFNKSYNGKKKKESVNVKYEDWYSQRIAYHLGYYNVTDLVLCEMETKQYVITAQLFLILTGNEMQSQVVLINK